MTRWFVSSAKTLDKYRYFSVIWSTEEFKCEDDARRFAADLISRGRRVEAGRLEGFAFKIYVPWRRAREWALSPDTSSKPCLLTDNDCGARG